ncbi:MAG: DUF2971 domain-containing protein [Desulfobacteraceae bacterium]|jgi:hypothetical protein|nr:DUF2971 domain-containing protein [Desulfobacteraceae bacterium]
MHTNIYDMFLRKHDLDKSFPPFLYHYTNGDALINIFENNEFWLTHVEYLNDKKEYSEGVDFILNIVDRRIDEPGADLLKEFKNTYLNDHWFDKPLNVGILSFSTKKDRLSQWRGYTKTGIGFCVCIDTQKLSSLNVKAHFRTCIYTMREKEKIINTIINEMINLKKNENKSIDEVYSAAFWLFTGFAYIARKLLIKNSFLVFTFSFILFSNDFFSS